MGISPSRAPYLIPSVLSKYRVNENSGKVIIQEATISDLRERLMNGDLDLIISLASDDMASFESVHLFDETILLAVPQVLDNHSSLEEVLLTLPHISVGRGQYMWNVMESVLRATDGKEPVIECQSIESAMSLVRKGMGTMFVPSYIRDYGSSDQNRGVHFYQLPLERYPCLKGATIRKVSLFYRKEQFLTQAERSFIQCAKEVARASTTS